MDLDSIGCCARLNILLANLRRINPRKTCWPACVTGGGGGLGDPAPILLLRRIRLPFSINTQNKTMPATSGTVSDRSGQKRSFPRASLVETGSKSTATQSSSENRHRGGCYTP